MGGQQGSPEAQERTAPKPAIPLPGGSTLNNIEYRESTVDAVEMNSTSSVFKDPSEVRSMRELKSPWSVNVEKAPERILMLPKLRAEVKQLAKEGDFEKKKPAKIVTAEGRAYLQKKAVLEKLEIIGLRQRVFCANIKGVGSKLPSVGIPHDVTITAKHPMVMIHMQVKEDPEGCEREVLIDDTTVQQVERYVEIETMLNSKQLTYRGARTKRRQLMEEKSQIESELWSYSPVWERHEWKPAQAEELKPLFNRRP